MSDKYTVTGTVKVIEDTQTFASGFQKREFVITTREDKYPQDIKFEVIKDKCETLDKLEAGQLATVHFNIRGNEHNGRYYVNLQAWRIVDESIEQPAAQPEPKPASHEDEDDDIPF